MSGGVDSSVAALLLREEGYEAVGLSLHMTSCHRDEAGSCCSAADRQDARETCRHLGIPHVTLDCREQFREKVIAPFVQDYASGRTPSPCILCNARVKFPALFEEAGRQGAQIIATGHYARAEEHRGRWRLLSARDAAKDQSYFLHRMTEEELFRTIFPLGGLTKDEVRALARRAGLATREKAESQEVCFVPERDCAAFVESHAAAALAGPGFFVSTAGKRLGRHRGIHAYTVGQRRGLGVSFGSRQYVVKIDTENNEVVLGDSDDLLRREMQVRELHWISGAPPPQKAATVRIRSAHRGAPGRVEPEGNGCARVLFDSPLRAIAPGQAAVFYQGEEVLGGGWIV